MIDSLYVSATGLYTNQLRLEAVANNLANIGTPAFKKARVAFDDVLHRSLAPTRTESGDGGLPDAVDGSWLGGGAVVSRVDRSFRQGALQATQRPLDLAIQGNGFFELERDDGTLVYSRTGTFYLNDLGDIVAANGLHLRPAIRVPVDAVEVLISERGDVRARVAGEPQPIDVGVVELVQFANVDGLKPVGEGLFEKTVQSGEAFADQPGAGGLGIVRQGFVEASNVDFTEELVELLAAQRAFQLSARMFQASDEILAEVNSLRR